MAFPSASSYIWSRSMACKCATNPANLLLQASAACWQYARPCTALAQSRQSREQQGINDAAIIVAAGSGRQAAAPPRRQPATAAANSIRTVDAGSQGSVLFLSPVWPERSSSAAGVRTCDLLEAFQRSGWDAAYASSSTPNEHTQALERAGVAAFQCQPNRERQLAEVLAAVRPTVVVFDRFYAEEAYSFRVRELAPEAVRILDMQDMHALRQARQQMADAGAAMESVLACRPAATAPDCLRELAAIHRSDLALVCSPVELQLLTTHYGVPASKLALAPFFAPPSPHAAAAHGSGQREAACPSFAERKHILCLGNWRHPPNLDSARWAASEVWPALRAALPPGHLDVELHMYGAYAAGAAQQLHRPKEGVHMKGFAHSLDIMLNYRVLLAPLRYGAGLKGKVVDSWWHGLPVLTTPIGAEGMTSADAGPAAAMAAAAAAAAGEVGAAVPPTKSAADGYIWKFGGGSAYTARPGSHQEWGGLYGGTTAAGISASAALLYADRQLWQACQRQGFELLQLLYDRDRNVGRVLKAVAVVAADLEDRRRLDFVGGMLWQQQLRATEFFSRWIELKESLKAGLADQGQPP